MNCQWNKNLSDNKKYIQKITLLTKHTKNLSVDVRNSMKMEEERCEPSCSSYNKIVINERDKKDKVHNESTTDEEEVGEEENGDVKIKHDSVDIPAQAKLVETYYEYLVLISIILIIFAAFRNSVTW